MRIRALGLAVVLGLAGCGGGSPAPRHTRTGMAHEFRLADGMDVTTLNPLLAVGANITMLGEFTMAHFTTFGAHNELRPELITELPTPGNGGISADGRTITYHLRRGVRWSDGAPFDSADVVFTVDTIRNRNNNISSRAAWDHLTGATAPNPDTVVFHLKAPFAAFASAYFSSFSPSCVLPKHLLAGRATINDAPYNALPVGIGPFRYTAFRRGDAVEMEANPYYFRGRPKLHKIVYKIITDDNTLYTQMQTGELDMWSTASGNFFDRLRSAANVHVATVLSPFMSGVYLNTTRPAVADPVVRRALRLATNRAAILHDANHDAGVLAESIVPRATADFDPGIARVPFDPDRATRLLDAAGWKRGPSGVRARAGVPLTVEIALPSGYAPSLATAELLRATWSKIGVDVEVKGFGDGQYFAPASSGGILATGHFDAALLSLPSDVIADENPYYGCAYAPPHGFNITRYCNAAADAAMQAYVATYDPQRRTLLARRFQHQIDADAPGIVTYERSFLYAYNIALTGFRPNSFGAFDDFLNVDIAGR